MQHNSKRFVRGMVIYAVVFLTVLAIGLAVFWSYMKAYENSRPHIAINSYLEALTEEYIVDLSQDLINQVDHNIQTEEQCRAFLLNAIDDISYAKKSKECTDTRQVFVLRTGETVIGEFSIVQQNAGEFGFAPWAFEHESFDLSVLNPAAHGYTVTVPFDHKVWINGIALDESYVTEPWVPYEAIEEYYDEYDLPYRVTYAIPYLIGKIEPVVTDAYGNEVTFDDHTDWTPYFHNCLAEETEELNELTEIFVNRYVAFTGSRKNTRENNYWRVLKYVVRGSDFALRLEAAVEGLEFGQSQRD